MCLDMFVLNILKKDFMIQKHNTNAVLTDINTLFLCENKSATADTHILHQALFKEILNSLKFAV